MSDKQTQRFFSHLYQMEKELEGIELEARNASKDMGLIARSFQRQKVDGFRIGTATAHVAETLKMAADDTKRIRQALSSYIRRAEREYRTYRG